jgi:uncharacterized protein YbjT (DUF2867 family)
MPSTDQTILVTGATGRQGGAVAARLLADGWKVRALTRDASGAKAKALKAAGAEVAEGDLDDRASLDRAAAGAWGVFSVHAGAYEGGPYGGDLDHERRSAANLAAAAKAAGVTHLVHSSSVGVGGPLEPFMDMLQRKAEAERAIEAGGVPHTILRPTSFMENTFDSPRELQNGALVSLLHAGTTSRTSPPTTSRPSPPSRSPTPRPTRGRPTSWPATTSRRPRRSRSSPASPAATCRTWASTPPSSPATIRRPRRPSG